MTNSDAQNYLSLQELPAAIVNNVIRAKKTSYTFTLKQEDFLRCKKKTDLLWFVLARGGVKNADISYTSSGKFALKNIVWWGWPMYNVKSEDGIIAAVQKAKQKNAPAFGLLMNNAFFEQCQKNPYVIDSALFKGGLSLFGKFYQSASMCAYWYQQCQYMSFDVVEGTMESPSAQKVLAAGMKGTEAIAFLMDASSWKLTLRNTDYLNEWAARAGLRTSYVQRNELRAYLFGSEEDAFLPAVRILASLANGTVNQLPEKHRQTLAAAQRITQKVSGSPLEMYTQIHDLLCRQITYEINPKCEDNSSCVGALLNGKAKCDGYSDAFYLCCCLKKLPAAYIVGKAKIKRTYTDDDNHMWNLILLNGTWRGVDVTWDDTGTDSVYDYFNIGLDRMKPAYAFSEFMLPKNMALKTNPLERPMQEYPANSEDDIASAVQDMRASGKKKITIRCSERFFQKFLQDTGILWRAAACCGVQKCDCAYRNNIITISDLVIFPNWAYCDSKADIVDALKAVRKNHAQEIVLVMDQKLFSQIVNDKFTELSYWLAALGLEAGAYQYNEDNCSVNLSNFKPYNAFTKSIANLSELKAAIQDGYSSGKPVLDLWLPPRLFNKIISDPQLLFSAIGESGINKEISWSYSQEQSRIQLHMN